MQLRGMDWQFGVGRYKLLHSEWVNKVYITEGTNSQFPEQITMEKNI